tara:strand:- start:2801 stop:4831 length:2031 start_codon:yes stop_codon:yes gene_type:complete
MGVALDPKLDAMINDVAAGLARVLSLKHPDISPTQPLVNVMYREGNHLPDKERIKKLRTMKSDVDFATAVEKLLVDIAGEAERAGDGNLLLTKLARSKCTFDDPLSMHKIVFPYYQFNNFTRKHNGHIVSTTRVGGVSQDLINDLVPIVRAWLRSCDVAMCKHFETEEFHRRQPERDDMLHCTLFAAPHNNHEERYSAEVDALIDSHALAIARRIAIPDDRQDESVAELSTVTLEQRINREVSRAAMAAESRNRDDLYALATLQALCLSEGRGTEAAEILSKRLHHIAYVTSKPLIELGLTGQNAASMNLEFLHGVCEEGLEMPVQIAIAQHWCDQHGPFALNAINQVIVRLESWQPDKSGFVEILSKKPNNYPYVPLMPFVTQNGQRRRQFVAPHKCNRRNGLNHVGRRIVRLTSFVLEMVAHGEFERGVVEKRIAANVANKRVKNVTYFKNKLIEQRDRTSFGMCLRGFSDQVVDPSSMISDEIRRTHCYLSKHSLAEMQCFFNPAHEGFIVLRDEFTRRTNAHMLVDLPREWNYGRFALDGLAVYLPSVERARNAITLQPNLNFLPNPLADLMRTIKKVRDWDPLCDGLLRIDAKDLAEALPTAPHVLKELSKQETLVKFYRPYAHDGRRFTTNIYEFDSLMLQALMRPPPVPMSEDEYLTGVGGGGGGGVPQ